MAKYFLFLFLLLSLLFTLSAGEEETWTIRNVSYIIDGKTREDVLSHYLNIKTGKIFSTKAELEVYLKDKIQLIKNQRTLAGGDIESKYESDPENPGGYFVDIQVNVKDTWNYILLPYAKFDSNKGFLVSLRGRNYNFLGGMGELSGNLDYLLTTSVKSEYSLNGGFTLPFYIWDYNWKFSFDEDVTISSDTQIKAYTKAGISVDIPLDNLTWQASLDQYYYLNQDGETDKDGYYMKTAARFGSSIPTRLDLPLLGELNYSPAIITSVAYKPFDTLSPDRKGYELGFEQEFSAGRIDWLGNFRSGSLFSANQNLRYNFTRSLWLSDTDIELQFHKAFGWGGFSSRLKGFYYYNSTGTDIGEPIRGILNARLDGNAAVFLNLDFPVKIWIWFLDKWFEGHISPFFDYALVKPDGGNFSLSDGWYSAGLEGFAFLKAARAIYLRMSFGVDLEALLEGAGLGDPAPRDGSSIYTIFIGLGHHY